MKVRIWRDWSYILAVGAFVGCAGSDNPLAISDLNPVIEVEIKADRIETFDEVEIHVHISEGGSPMMMSMVEFELSPAHGEESVMVTAEAAGEDRGNKRASQA